jgi:2-polyprenyl-3-methyl-5-hydroxy-6-metoxy-1,4-benzoquinol methylase
MISVSDSILRRVTETYGATYEAYSGIPAEKSARDVLDEEKVHDQIAVFCRAFGLARADLRGKRLLEVGSGFGIFLAVSRRDYGVESFGIEPASGGFDSSRELGREILAGYGLDASIVTDSKGEDLPFPDNHFDLIFSSTVLEHTEDPQLVLEEAIRVLRPGGRMQFVYPNYGAFFEGHYALPWIPYMSRGLGRLWVRLWGRDPAYVDTLQLTNYFRTRRWLRGRRDVQVVTYGEEVFRTRMLGLQIKTWAGLGRVKRWLEVAHRLHAIRPLTWLLLGLKSFDPIILSLVKRPAGEAPPAPDNRHIYEVRWTDWTDMKVYGPTSRWLRALIGDHLRRLTPTSQPVRVLDVGCGEGTTTDFLAAELSPGEVVGTDRSEMGIQCARSRYQRPNLTFVRREETASLPGSSFHLVTCLEVLEHVEDWRAMARELARLSSRHVIVSFPTGRMRPFERNVGHLRNFRRGQFERFAGSIGLEPVSVYYAGFPFYSPLFRGLCNVFNSGGNSLTIGRYSRLQKLTSNVIYVLFRHLSMKRHGDQFCGLFIKRADAVPAARGP